MQGGPSIPDDEPLLQGGWQRGYRVQHVLSTKRQIACISSTEMHLPRTYPDRLRTAMTKCRESMMPVRCMEQDGLTVLLLCHGRFYGHQKGKQESYSSAVKFELFKSSVLITQDKFCLG
jgi:hypothetical protein